MTNKPIPFTKRPPPPEDPPRPLGDAGRALWDRVQSEFMIADCGGVELLAQCCEAADRVAELAAVIARDGPTIQIGKGYRQHPCLKDELANRAFICRTLQNLGVVHEPIGPVGRPSRPFGWQPNDN